jgi:putative endopeptidase
MTFKIHSRTPWAVAALGASLLAGGAAGGLRAQEAPRKLGVEVANFDTSVRPQDDFYRYVNGTWLKRTEIPGDRSSYGSFTQLSDRSEAALRAIIEEAAAAPSRPQGSDVQKIGDFYLSYMDTARIEALGVKPLEQELHRVAQLRKKEELPELFAELQQIGVGTPIGFFVGQDPKQATRYVASVSQAGLGLPDRDYYFKEGASFERTRAGYAAYIERLLRLVGEKDPKGAAAAVVALEKSLAERHWDRARSRDREATYNAYDLAKLSTLTPGFSWAAYLDEADAEKTPVVIVRQPDYFQALGGIIASTPVETWRRYLTFKLLDAYADRLSSDFARARFEFRGKTLQGQREERPRWKRAVEAVQGPRGEDVMGELVGQRYVERHFRPEAKARMEELVRNVVAAFREGIEQLEWMSPETKAQAQAKLAKFNVKIGYPEKWRDYSALTVRPGDLVGNSMRARRFSYDRMVGRLGKPIDRTEWGMTPQTVNAYYSSSMNEIVFPAAILQPPFFDPEADDAVNYGGIGAVIGHEISHGFDDQGSRSNGEGNLVNWWSEQDQAAFKERTDALVAQYGGYVPLEGMNINGRLTLGENIGDLSGLAVAYRAYRKSLGAQEAPVIGGLTGDQRFFMGWAQIWRTLYRDEALRQRLLTDPHSPGEYRTNAVLRNMPEFYAAFGVKEGDQMYLPPEKRVKIW